MFTGNTFFLIAIISLAILAFLIFYKRGEKPGKNLTLLAGLAFAFILCSILIDNNPTVAYSLFGAGVVLAVVDIITKGRAGKK